MDAVMPNSEHWGERSPGDYPDRWKHHSVGKLIRRTKDYIVHLDAKEHRLDWETSASYDAKKASNENYSGSMHNSVLCDVALLEARPTLGLEGRIVEEFRLLLGEALVCALENDYSTANKMINSAATYIDARSREKSRVWYLCACLWVTAPCVVLSCLFVLNKEYLQNALGHAFYWTILAAFAGAIGALLSVILRVGHLSVDCASGQLLHNLEAFSRILAGSISGVFVSVAFYSGVFFPAVVHASNAQCAIILLAMISGVAERSAVSLIDKFQSEKLETNTIERNEK